MYTCIYVCVNIYIYTHLRMEDSQLHILAIHHNLKPGYVVLLQVLFTGNQQEEKEVEMSEEGQKEPVERGFPGTLLRGTFSEEESAQSFQDALRQWRGDKKRADGEPLCEDAMWTPVRPGKL